MTREKMRKAVLVALKRSGRDMNEIAENVLISMEMALALEDDEKSYKPLDFEPMQRNSLSGLPIPPQAAVPVGPDGGGLINTTTETVQANPVDHRPLPSVRRADGPTVDLPKLLEVLHSHTPETIDIVVDHPEKGKLNVRLDRNVIADPIAKTARLTYKHKDLSDDMMAAVVLEADGPLPDLQGAMAEVRRRAEKLYAYRPSHIEPVPPPPPRGYNLNAPPKLNVEEALQDEANAPKPSLISGLKFENFRFGQ